jgi:hypothetical protein
LHPAIGSAAQRSRAQGNGDQDAQHDPVDDERCEGVGRDELQQPRDRGIGDPERDDDADAIWPMPSEDMSVVTASKTPAAVSAGMARKKDSRVAVTRSIPRTEASRDRRPGTAHTWDE